jgi:hypothetical protein
MQQIACIVKGGERAIDAIQAGAGHQADKQGGGIWSGHKKPFVSGE